MLLKELKEKIRELPEEAYGLEIIYVVDNDMICEDFSSSIYTLNYVEVEEYYSPDVSMFIGENNIKEALADEYDELSAIGYVAFTEFIDKKYDELSLEKAIFFYITGR